MSLSATQRFFRRFVSAKTFAAMEADSRGWIVEGRCGYRSNVWDMGGIRYKARGRGRATWGRCPACGKRHGFRIYRTGDS